MSKLGPPKGHAKWGGRQKGTPNKATKELLEICKKKGVKPFERLLDFCQHADPSIAMAAVKEACQYLYAKRKAVEIIGGEDEGTVGATSKALAEIKDAISQAAKERKK